MELQLVVSVIGSLPTVLSAGCHSVLDGSGCRKEWRYALGYVAAEIVTALSQHVL